MFKGNNSTFISAKRRNYEDVKIRFLLTKSIPGLIIFASNYNSLYATLSTFADS